MIIRPDDNRVVHLYKTQDIILERLQPILKNYPQIWMSGGTVLAREWLHHRISFDLDFFVPPDFQLENLEKELSGTGYKTERKFISNDIYQQMFGKYSISGVDVEVSFIQDKFHDLFQPVYGSHINMAIQIEDVKSIYRRKASIIIGLSEAYSNGRNKARDVFDLYVLSKKVLPVKEFVSATWGEMMLENFNEGLANADPLQIAMDTQLFAYPEWEQVESGDKALALLMEDVGMTNADFEEAWQVDDEENDDDFRPTP